MNPRPLVLPPDGPPRRKSCDNCRCYTAASRVGYQQEVSECDRATAERRGAIRNTTSGRTTGSHQMNGGPHIGGAGFGGLVAARALRHAPVRMMVIDQTTPLRIPATALYDSVRRGRASVEPRQERLALR